MTMWGVGLAVLLGGLACEGPISTMRSPYHLRIVEVRNATENTQTLKIEPTEREHVGASTTFTGLLGPGEVKVLYLYHGLEYDIRILDAEGWTEVTRTTMEVDRDVDLVYHGESLVADLQFKIDLGEPEPIMTFADSLQMLDPFGLRSRRALEPDTTQMRGPEDPNRRLRRRGDPQ